MHARKDRILVNTIYFRAAFLLLIAFVLYPYTLYPLLLWCLTKLRPRPWCREEIMPRLSVIIAAHNEEAVIRDKLENTLAFDYPLENLEIVVASDGSTDRTDEIVKEFAPAARLVRLPGQSGKQVALNHAVEVSTGEVLLFTDASVFLNPQAGRAVVRNFADPQVGAVSSVISIYESVAAARDASVEGTGPDAEGAYLNLDLAVRRFEANVGSAVGCCGSCYAVRRECFVPFDPGACNDFVSALDAAGVGYRVVMDEEVVGRMAPAKSTGNEFRRKVRTIAGGLDTLWRSKILSRPAVRPLFVWQLLSHKVARWLGPPALSAAIVVAVIGALFGDRYLAAASMLSSIPLAMGVVGLVFPGLNKRLFPIRLASFSLIAWWAAIVAWYKFLTGQRQITWKPTVRETSVQQQGLA